MDGDEGREGRWEGYLRNPLRSRRETYSQLLDTCREDLSAVDPDYAVPGEGEECLFHESTPLPLTSKPQNSPTSSFCHSK
jgi:hypothetical protein